MRDFFGDREGELGVERMLNDEGDLGDDAASNLVNLDGCTGPGREGRVANGT